MKIVPTSFTFLGKDVDNMSMLCSDGLHGECLRASILAASQFPEFHSTCDCRCHDLASCQICATDEMQLVELASHSFDRHSVLPANEWGPNGLDILAIGLGMAPSEKLIARSLRANRINYIYTRQVLDWFRFGPAPSDELPPMACNMCSWAYYGQKGRQPYRDNILERHLIDKHGWKRQIPTHETNLSFMPYFIATPFEILTHREPIEPPPYLDLALAVVRMQQMRGHDDWELFQPRDILPFLPGGYTIAGALNELTRIGWVNHLREADYIADPSLPLACLRAGLGKSRQLKK